MLKQFFIIIFSFIFLEKKVIASEFICYKINSVNIFEEKKYVSKKFHKENSFSIFENDNCVGYEIKIKDKISNSLCFSSPNSEDTRSLLSMYLKKYEPYFYACITYESVFIEATPSICAVKTVYNSYVFNKDEFPIENNEIVDTDKIMLNSIEKCDKYRN